MPYETSENQNEVDMTVGAGMMLVIILACLMMAVLWIFLLIPQTKAAEIRGRSVFEATNDERTLHGLQPLRPNLALVKAAQLKADDMAKSGYFAHLAPSGVSQTMILKEVGYKYRYAGQNLAEGFENVEDLETSWENSPTHRAAMLNPLYTETGVGLARGFLDGEEVTFVVQEFGRR